MKIIRIFSYFLVLVIIVLGITFAVLNANPVRLNYYIGSQDINLSLLLVFALGIGIVLGFSAFIPTWFKLKNKNRTLRNRIKTMEQEAKTVAHFTATKASES